MDWMVWRFTFTAYAGALSPDMKRLTGRAVDAHTDGEVLNVNLPPEKRTLSTRLFYVHVMCCWSEPVTQKELSFGDGR